MSQSKKSVLIIGGSGMVGSQAARTLRRLYPDLPIAIGGRDLAKAQRVAQDIGGASATRIDLSRGNLGLPQNSSFAAIVMFVKDDTLNSLRFAQTSGAAYLSVSSGLFEIGPEIARVAHAPKASAVLMASSWLAGVATLPTLAFARAFRRIDSIAIAAVLDEKDIGGQAAQNDFDRIESAAPKPLILKEGRFIWALGEDAAREVIAIDGHKQTAQAFSMLDVPSLAAATDATSVRFDLVFGESSGRRAGGRFTSETIIELEGELLSGERAKKRHDIVHAEGQAPVTALFVALGVERLLGLDGGAPAQPGLYLPDTLIDPDVALRRLKELGADVTGG